MGKECMSGPGRADAAIAWNFWKAVEICSGEAEGHKLL